MDCPVKKRNGRIVVGVVVVATMVAKPPKTPTDFALYGVGAVLGIMLADKLTCGRMAMQMPTSGCGCPGPV